jgi:predicted AAA+ superfamily ATPase
VCYYRGWYSLRSEVFGLLWEHYVLNEMYAHFQTRKINYWRDKQGHEVDYVIALRNQPPVAVECKWSASDFEPSGIKAFRRQYPQGESYVAANDVGRQYARSYGNTRVTFVNLTCN